LNLRTWVPKASTLPLDHQSHWLALTHLLKYVKIGQSIKQKDWKGKNNNSNSKSVICAFFLTHSSSSKYGVTLSCLYIMVFYPVIHTGDSPVFRIVPSEGQRCNWVVLRCKGGNEMEGVKERRQGV
jgi:hypothetical protein